MLSFSFAHVECHWIGPSGLPFIGLHMYREWRFSSFLSCVLRYSLLCLKSYYSKSSISQSILSVCFKKIYKGIHFNVDTDIQNKFEFCSLLHCGLVQFQNLIPGKLLIQGKAFAQTPDPWLMYGRKCMAGIMKMC